METVIQIAAACVLAALAGLLVKRGSPELGLLVSLAAAAASLLCLSGGLREFLEFLDELAGAAGLGGGLMTPLYKTVGIALVVRVGGSLCRDAGESALGAVVETAGTVCAVLVALPLFRTVLGILVELMKG